ncbi:ERV2 protein-like protein [Ophiocordyceps camponoti-floridani]|uniref:Sulfhydryl oxidase n=1 Tax=Ophiocordyceps camponoti-floridani TaxID=2030778 RepID=A0A8H4VBR8_9HYPO|nr:ERV2 protein-like protein [Ophiocordyceps camponoti-floridani]
MARRTHVTLMLLVGLAFFFSVSYLYSGPGSLTARDAARLLNKVRNGPSQTRPSESEAGPGFRPDLGGLPDGLLDGESIAPKLENATLKAELGRATWKFLHTMVAKYPEKPTPEDRKTLQLFFMAFGKLYPCGDCARHFRGLLKQMPPQTGSRNSAAGWLCEMHNQVNKRLEKSIFDCNNIGDFYDCGCGDDKKDGKKKDEGVK